VIAGFWPTMSEKTCVAVPVGLLMRCNGGAAVIAEPDLRETGVLIHDKPIMATKRTKRTARKPMG
jgi:hypothetical protein